MEANDGVKFVAQKLTYENHWSESTLHELENKISPDYKLSDVHDPKLVSQIAAIIEGFGIVPETGGGHSALVVLAMYLSLSMLTGKFPPITIKTDTHLLIGAGSGSSASFCVCVAAALLCLFDVISAPESDAGHNYSLTRFEMDLVNKWAFQGEIIIHGNPSGLDNSVCTYGGIISYQNGKIHNLGRISDLHILLTHSGIERSTKKLVKEVQELKHQIPEVVESIFSAIHAISERSEKILSQSRQSQEDTDYLTLQLLTTMNHHLLVSLGLGHPSLDTIVQKSSHYGLHSKMTGAGRGGCAITVVDKGQLPKLYQLRDDLDKEGFQSWVTTVGGDGLCLHKGVNELSELL